MVTLGQLYTVVVEHFTHYFSSYAKQVPPTLSRDDCSIQAVCLYSFVRGKGLIVLQFGVSRLSQYRYKAYLEMATLMRFSILRHALRKRMVCFMACIIWQKWFGTSNCKLCACACTCVRMSPLLALYNTVCIFDLYNLLLIFMLCIGWHFTIFLTCQPVILNLLFAFWKAVTLCNDLGTVCQGQW